MHTLAPTKSLWPSWYRPPVGYVPFPRSLVRRVAAGFGISYAEIVGADRTSYFVDARATAARLMRDLGMSEPQIGRHLGGRDRSSIHNVLMNFTIYQKRNAVVGEVYADNSARFSKGVTQ